MDPAYVHLLTNHIPAIGTIAALLLIGFALVRRSRDVAFAALGAMVIAALITIPVYLTGESAEERVEHIAGVSENNIEEHEEAGKYALIGVEIAGGIALIALFFVARSAQHRPGALLLVAVFALIALVMVGRTAYLGGMIRHTEVHGGTGAAGED